MLTEQIAYEQGNQWISLQMDDRPDTGFDRQGLAFFGKIRIKILHGHSAHYYFYSVQTEGPAKINISPAPEHLNLLLGDRGAFIYYGGGMPRLLVKTLSDIFYDPAEWLSFELEQPGHYSFHWIQIPLSVLEPLRSLNGSLQWVTEKMKTRRTARLTLLPLPMDPEECSRLEDLFQIRADEPVVKSFVDNQCLLILLQAIEKQIAKRSNALHESLPQYDQENLERAAEEMITAPGFRISIGELARKYQLSPSRFKVLFRQQFGGNIHQFLLKIRMERATRLLVEGRLSIRDIAGELGYAYASSFSAAFKKKMGTSPRRLGNRLRNGLAKAGA